MEPNYRGRSQARGDAALLEIRCRLKNDLHFVALLLLHVQPPSLLDTVELALLLLDALLSHLGQLLFVIELHGLLAYPESRQLDLVIDERQSLTLQPRLQVLGRLLVSLLLTVSDALDNLVNRLRLLRPLLGLLKLLFQIAKLSVLVLDVTPPALELVLLHVQASALFRSLLLLLPQYGLQVLDRGAELRPLLEQLLRFGLDFLDLDLEFLFLLYLLPQEFLELLLMLGVQLLLLDLLLVQKRQLADVDLHLVGLRLQQALL